MKPSGKVGKAGNPGKVGKAGNPGILGNMGKSRICWLTWRVVVGSWRPRQQMGYLLHHNRIRPFVAAVVTGAPPSIGIASAKFK